MINTLEPESLVHQLQWRYATKKFDDQKKIPNNVWTALEDSLVLSPSSYGLQPWKFIVITDQNVKESLVAASWKQRQVADASHLVVFAVRDVMEPADVDRHVQRIAEVQNRSVESLEGYRKMMLHSMNQPREDSFAWASLQVYIALGIFMTSAAVLGVDTCPMEGIMPAKYNEILAPYLKGYSVIVACPAGYRALDDKTASNPKVRFKKDEVLVRV